MKPLIVIGLLCTVMNIHTVSCSHFYLKSNRANMVDLTSFDLQEIQMTLYFKKGKTVLIEKSYRDLFKLISQLEKLRNVDVELTGYTDNTGSEKMNLQLSVERAEEVSKIIKENIVNPSLHFIEIGKGHKHAIKSNNTEENRQMNRRVEIVLIQK